MNALNEIQNKAQVIVNELADREIARMKDRYNEFNEWLTIEGNPIMSRYNNEISTYESVEKFIYMTQYHRWDHEQNKYILPTQYPTSYREQREMFYDKGNVNMVSELKTMLRDGWESRYREEFVNSNMMKLNRALAKHLNNEMSASNINVNIGGDGAEVTANVDDKLFRTFGTLCGGYVQCLHYRYRSSLK